VPTVIVGTDEFVELAKLESRNRGLADLPLALVPHPLGGIPEADVLKKVDAAVPMVVRGVTIATAPTGGTGP
jgi:hypothetical protein